MPDNVASWLLIVGVVLFCVLLVIALSSYVVRPVPTTSNQAPPHSVSFLFEGETLINIAPDDHQSDKWDRAATWKDVRDTMIFRFPDLPLELDGSISSETIPSLDQNDAGEIGIIGMGRICRVSLFDPLSTLVGQRHWDLAQRSTTAGLVAAMRRAPFPCWETDNHGHILWQNLALQRLLAENPNVLDALQYHDGKDPQSRIRAWDQNAKTDRWFEVTTETGQSGRLHYASDITEIVQAEATQRTFVQTLTKTFSTLSIGLAVFDKNRQLALFNPALVDLTGLAPETLSGRPDILTFFDKLRDRRILPEPKNYATWRTQMQTVFEQASDGVYTDTWSLPGDVTYRVTGHPHPNGAVAFFLEDISDEVTLNRRFRSQLDLREAVLDAQDSAIFVFSASLCLTFCNDAAGRLMKLGRNDVIETPEWDAILKRLEHSIGASSDWAHLDEHLRDPGMKGDQAITIVIEDGRILHGRTNHLIQGYKVIALDQIKSKCVVAQGLQTA